MKIGPVDIRNHTFTKKMRGVDESEVRDFLDLAADRLEECILEMEDLRSKLDRMEAEVKEYRTLERKMRDSLLSAEQLVDDRVAQAEKEAQIIIKNAEVQGEKLLLGSRTEAGRLQAEIDDLRRQKVTYIERFRALLRSQVKILEASLESFDPDVDPATIRPVGSVAPPRPVSYPGTGPGPEAVASVAGRDELFPGEPGGENG